MASNKKARPAPAVNGEPAIAPAAKEPRPHRMTKPDLELRVATLEAELGRLKAVLEEKPGACRLGWKRIIGSFANDPAFDEAMRLGREWRESFRPKNRSRKVKSSKCRD